ncbi:hypothetical protein BH11MYX4_BH11MYX4_30280 [soil metagenome]
MRSRRPPTQTFNPARGAELAEAAEPPTSDGREEAPPAVRLEEDGPTSKSGERYSVRRRIGLGGMGTIDLVHDRVVGRDVALKQMRPRTLDPRAEWASFEREARLQGQLEHPAIVPVYDLGKGEDGSPYFTMKRVRGESLASILDRLAEGDAETRARFSRRKLLTAFAQLCLAAHYAHERGVIHRDIKPANVMLGGYGEVYLLDWGIAKVRGDAASLAPAGTAGASLRPDETTDGSVVGSLGTMAPEQAEGLAIDARADVYALGAVLF